MFCIAVTSEFLLCSQFVKLLILPYEPGYLNKAKYSIVFARSKSLLSLSLVNDHYLIDMMSFFFFFESLSYPGGWYISP